MWYESGYDIGAESRESLIGRDGLEFVIHSVSNVGQKHIFEGVSQENY